MGLHAASWASEHVAEYGELLGATTGAHKYNGERGALRVDDPDSPITKQFGGKALEFVDKFSHYIPTGPYSREKLHVLLSMDPARTDLPGNQYTNRPDNEYGIVWVRRYGKGRVFNVGLGHRREFYEWSEMRQIDLRGSAVHPGRPAGRHDSECQAGIIQRISGSRAAATTTLSLHPTAPARRSTARVLCAPTLRSRSTKAPEASTTLPISAVARRPAKSPLILSVDD